MKNTRQHTNSFSVALFALFALVVSPFGIVRAQDDEEKIVPFVPEKCFSDRTVLLASVDIGGLRVAVPNSPFGKIASHPELQKALGKLPEMLREQVVQQTGPFKLFFGGDIFQFLDTMSTTWTVAVEENPGSEMPSCFVAIDLAKERQRVLTLFSTYVHLAANGLGVKPTKKKIGDENVISIALDREEYAAQRVVLGNHLVLSVGLQNALDNVVARYVAHRGANSEVDASLVSTAAYRAAKNDALSDPLVSVYFSGTKFVGLMKSIVAAKAIPGNDQGAPAMIDGVAGALGFDRLDGVRFDLGFSDGDWEESLSLQSEKGFSGLVKTFVDAFDAPQSTDAFGLVPASATHFGSYSIDKGLFFREIEALALSLPEEWQVAPIYRGLVHLFEDATGLSMKEQLQKLPRLDVTSFQVYPPAGGLLPDKYAICPTGQIVAYLQALDAFARKTGAELIPLELDDRSGVYIRAASLMRSFGIGPASGPLQNLDDEIKMAILALDPGISLAFAPITDDWILVADSPQALERYFLVHEKAPKVAESDRWKPLLAATKGSAFAVLSGGEDFLVGYNTATSILGLLGPTAQPAIVRYGIDVAALPAGEEFLPLFRPGFILAKKDANSVSIRGHRVLTNVIPAVVPESLALSAKLIPAWGIR